MYSVTNFHKVNTPMEPVARLGNNISASQNPSQSPPLSKITTVLTSTSLGLTLPAFELHINGILQYYFFISSVPQLSVCENNLYASLYCLLPSRLMAVWHSIT